MMTANQIAIVILSALAGTVMTFVSNFLIFDIILIPNLCHYHTKDITKYLTYFTN